MAKSASTHQKTAALESGRLNRFIARAGVCSRRKADELIDAGLVKVNGKCVRTYWYSVEAGDAVHVNGKLITPRGFEYLLLNKPKDTITTVKDERDRRTVMDLITLGEGTDGLFPVGRLDRNTTGVLLLTNDGELGHRLMHPSYRVTKQYKVEVSAPVRSHELEKLRRGIELEDGVAKVDRVAYVNDGDLRVIGIEIHEGRNRQVRRMLEALSHEVVTLERVAYAGLTVRGVRRGRWRRLRDDETKKLRRLVGQ